ncbi:complement factor B-like [Pseudorasbora parva]|uniref:complement factor B-like n=1 Tax=Pseudorasbora parva TaxID=51549 RepID=UPI00351EA3BC
MECEQRWNWLMLAMICPLIAGAPSSMSIIHASCPEENLNITGGSFVLSNGYSDGSFLRYICPSGYYPSVQSRRCQYGLWTPKTSTRKTPECKKVTCPNPHVLENGEVTPYKDRYYVNDTTSYSCHSDYNFRGSAVRVCKPNGKWSGSTPICGHDSDHCPDPGVPPGSRRTGHIFNINNKVSYRCDSTLTLIGSKERVCQEGGQWSGTEPQCYAHFTYDTPEEASEAFSSALKSNLAVSQQYEEEDQHGKKITLDQGGKLDIYIAVDASGSINKTEFEKAKKTIKMLMEKISDYQVSPNYEILIFATEVHQIISMRDFKTNGGENLLRVFERLERFNYKDQYYHTGTNIAKLYSSIFASMSLEKFINPEGFLETQHVIIVFTDGQANMGGNPIPKANKIKHLVTQDDPKREKKLDLYVFGIGDVQKEYINGLVSQRDQEKHFFHLLNLDEVQTMFDNMIDESTSVGLCGIHQNYDQDNKRRAYPWLAQITFDRPSLGKNCMGSLVTSSYILTAAHCFKKVDTPDRITVILDKDVVKVKRFILHPEYDITSKKHMGINESYEFDVALIQLDKPVTMSAYLRPICIPCTKETNGALRLSDSEGTCRKHEELLLGNEIVEAAFTSKMDSRTNAPQKIKKITIKRGKYRDACVEDAKKAQGIKVTNAKDVVTDNFLCSGGTEPQVDDVACKGEGGGATYVNKKSRLIQVGIVSWGVRDICSKNPNSRSKEDTRDYHTNLFSENIQSFLKEHLGNDQIGHPLLFF